MSDELDDIDAAERRGVTHWGGVPLAEARKRVADETRSSVVATKTVIRVEALQNDRLLLHCADGTVEIEASGEQRRQWLETSPGTVFDIVGEGT